MNDFTIIDTLNRSLRQNGKEGLLPELLKYINQVDTHAILEKMQWSPAVLRNCLKKHVDPRFETVMALLEVLGFELRIDYRHTDTASVFNRPRNHMLGVAYPVVHKFWHPIKNGHLSANNIPAKARPVVWWHCSEGHEWQMSTSELLRDIKFAFSESDLTENGYAQALLAVCPKCRKKN